jgi:uncharacterized protein (TIGR03118 family)
MRVNILSAIVVLSVVLGLGGMRPAAAQFYAQHNLVSDDVNVVPADLGDQDLVNAWGLVAGPGTPGTPWWVANNGTATSTLYNGTTGAKVALTVTVPGAMGQQSAPTGLVFNGGTGFDVTDSAGTSPARFIFASEDGTISGFKGGTLAILAVDNSASGAVYKGLAIDDPTAGNFLYATNFHAGTIDVFDRAFNPVVIPGGFTDPNLPNGYAPFGIRSLGGVIYVTYALQDAAKHDDVPGQGHGYVDAFDPAGKLLRRVASKGQLNSPWGLALAPDAFGTFSNDLLIGNFGNGRIHAFDPTRFTGTGEFQSRGPLHSADGPPIAIDGLWSLAFGNGGNAGPTTTLFFTAGPFGEQHGLFGSLVLAPPPGGD